MQCFPGWAFGCLVLKSCQPPLTYLSTCKLLWIYAPASFCEGGELAEGGWWLACKPSAFNTAVPPAEPSFSAVSPSVISCSNCRLLEISSPFVRPPFSAALAWAAESSHFAGFPAARRRWISKSYIVSTVKMLVWPAERESFVGACHSNHDDKLVWSLMKSGLPDWGSVVSLVSSFKGGISKSIYSVSKAGASLSGFMSCRLDKFAKALSRASPKLSPADDPTELIARIIYINSVRTSITE